MSYPIRLGLISDVHSNPAAFRAVLDEFDRRNVDQIICLGDIIGLGANPEACVAILRELVEQGKILSIVRGNHEDYLLKKLPVHNHNDANSAKLPEEILDLFRWNHSQISQESINFLSQFPRQENIRLGRTKIYISHYPVHPTGTFMPFFMKPSLGECRKIFRFAHANIYLFGHTHVRTLRIGRNGDYYINPGSVGCPIGTDSASAGILELRGRRISYQQLDVDYDVERAIKKMLSYNYEHPAITHTVNQFYRPLDDFDFDLLDD